MTQVNLLPTDTRVGHQVRRATGLVIAAGAAVLCFLFFVFVLQSGRLANEQRTLSAQQALNAGLSTQIASLSRFGELKENVAAHQALLTAVEAGEVHRSGILRDASMVLPDEMVLTSMSGSVNQAIGGSGGAGAGLIGGIQFSGISVDNPTLAKWLTRLEEVTGWVNPWVTSVTKDANTGRVTFNGSVDLSPDATVHGAAQ
jgi:Tfp pilus assembly protein PilN